jgi:hypothetical protein
MNLEKKDWSHPSALQKERPIQKKPHKPSANLEGKILTRKEKNGRGEWI